MPIYKQTQLTLASAVLLHLVTYPDMALANSTSYEDSDVIIDFGSSGYAVAERESDGTFAEKSYFASYVKLLRFCPQPALPPDVQQVHSKTGWLCELYVLPAASRATAKKSARSCYKHNKHGAYSDVEEVTIRNKKVLKWRYEIGKTRLDHYLVFGKKHNYLFVSSPYGEHGSIVPLIEKMVIK